MDANRLGLQFRALRVRLDLRQSEVGALARMSRAVVSRIERGLIGNLQFDTLDQAARALGATLDVRLRWRGEQLDRLVDEAHAALGERVVALLRAFGWEVAVEASFSIWGERGSIDVLGFDRRTLRRVRPAGYEFASAIDCPAGRSWHVMVPRRA